MNTKTLLCTVSVLALVIPQGICGEGGGFTRCGLDGNYYANTTLTAPAVFSRRDVRLNFWWNNPTGNPLNVSGTKSYPMASTNFSVVWTGQIVAKYSEVYTFTTTSDEGMNLWIKPTTTGTWTKVIDHWTAHSWADKTGTWTFTSGVLYDIKVEYWQGTGDAVCKLFWESPSTVKEYVEPATPVGLNTGFTNDWGSDLMFADVIRQGKPFGTSNAPHDPTGMTVDSNGWPNQANFGQIVSAGDPNVPPGTYNLSFNGQATIAVQFGWATIQGVDRDPLTNTTTAQVVVPANCASLNLIFTSANRNPEAGGGPGLTNIKLMRPGESSTSVFTSSYKSLMKNFATIRGMNYFQTNGNPVTSWSGRTKGSTLLQTSNDLGGSIEYMIMLCNETGKDLWLNLPAQVPEDFFTKAAQACRYGTDGTNPYTSAQSNPVFPPLNPNLKVYVEWSNEVWNWGPGFYQYGQNYDAAVAAVMADTPEGLRLNYDNLSKALDGSGQPVNGNKWRYRRWIDRLIRASICFRTVYTDTVFVDRVRPVFQDHYGQDYEALIFANIYYNNADGGTHSTPPRPLSYYIWGAGGGWYGGPSNPNGATVDEIYANPVPPVGSPSTEAVSARAYGLHVAGYEGGFVVGGDTCTPVQYAANLDARAQAAVVTQTTEWFNSSGDMPMVYQAAGGDTSSYGLATPTLADQNRPKILGYIEMTNALRPPVTLGYSLPASMPNTNPTGWLYNTTPPPKYLLRVATPGTYTITISFGTGTWPVVQVDGITLGGYPTYPTGGTFSNTVTLTRGVHGIWIRNRNPTASQGWMGSVHINSGGTDIVPEADTYVHSGFPTTTYGTSTALGIKDGPTGYTRITYLRFPVTQTGTTYKLYLKTTFIGNEGTGNRPIEVRQLPSDTWSESTMDWNTRAASNGALIGTITDAGTVGNVYSLDVTSYVNAQVSADGKAGFVLVQPAGTQRYVEIGSREDVVNKPLLIRQ